ncbi:unnamed protein product [Withania somnifera]
MAASKSYFSRSNYCFLTNDRNVSVNSDAIFELDESDIWNSTSPSLAPERSSLSPEYRKKQSITKRDRKTKTPAAAASFPVNVPDWSKILKDEYRDDRRRDYEPDDDDDDDVDDRIPPHEFLARQLARTRIASFSVHEGVGRTLKGRDLSRVRNAIFEKTGFED